MYQKTTMIKNPSGLHARPASEFIACAKKFNAKIAIGRTNEEEKVNAKSMVLLLSLGIGCFSAMAPWLYSPTIRAELKRHWRFHLLPGSSPSLGVQPLPVSSVWLNMVASTVSSTGLQFGKVLPT